ncbi:MAG: carbon-nitrogen hydrolase family protein [Gemmatimonadetes bacterium]|nr:carbon-nitrogen hydrolase family protein [Gemmatimonadota bacterium]MYG16564.1 carbon-nitrogen hydrolase family protein [Gemmatimonadota bacterium]MYH17831.1 carbon-nitrogen hydrolase family protein [Gemmatimonadota bacterium]MYK98180.1 carbon-nitrogen hydrolase family protein [Gemmatimonadota bacterium]
MSSSNEVRIGCVQTPATATFDEAIEVASRLAGDAVAKGAELVCLPEFCGGLRTDNGMICPPSAPEADHPVVSALRDFTRNAGVWTLIGSVAVDGLDGRLINRGFLVDDQGEIRARYDKIHLFDVDLSRDEQYRESDVVSPGETAVVADTPWGRLGMTTCYDLRFPQLYRTLAQAGAEILAVPAAFTKTTGQAHWHVLNRARAIENGAVVVAPCAAGSIPGGGEVYGHSLIISPWGEVLADGGEDVDVIVATVDLGSVASARGRVPSLRHDRPFSLPAKAKADRRSVA